VLLQLHTGRRLVPLEIVPGEGRECRVAVDGRDLAVELLDAAPGRLELRIEGRRRHVWLAEAGAAIHVCVDGRVFTLVRHTGDEVDDLSSDSAGPHVTAPLPGRVVKVLVEPGRPVAAGEPLLILEAMKMETEITAPVAGTIQAVHVAAGGTVALGDPLVDVEPVG